VYVVILEITLVDRAVGPAECALTLLLAIVILAGVSGFVGPLLVAGARLSVFEPRAFEINAIFEVIIVTVAVIPIVQPFSFVYISIAVDQASSTISHVRSPLAFVQRTIIAKLDTKTLSFLSLFINKADIITFFI
jgi:hypothetical protein